jgi:hypothetical protein
VFQTFCYVSVGLLTVGLFNIVLISATILSNPLNLIYRSYAGALNFIHKFVPEPSYRLGCRYPVPWTVTFLNLARQFVGQDVCELTRPCDYRGREEPFQTLPSLRTVRAVLPHTALQSVVPISGQIDDLSLLQGASVIATESINFTLLPRYPQLLF